MNISQVASRTTNVALNKVVKNTYLLLSMTLAFSGAMALLSMNLNLPMMNPFLYLIVFFGLMFAIEKTINSSMGLVLTFALTGFLGVYLGPILNYYLTLPNGGELVGTALFLTALIFFSLSAYVFITGKNFAFLSSMLFTGSMVVLGAIVVMLVGSLFGLHMSLLSVVISGLMVFLMSGYILFETSNIINNGETNYIRATVSLYLSIYNLFLSLLHILGLFSNRE